jgi:anti-sigma regulatory factor (Ser/Thr protein kinase)/predicted transcriptional regulator
MTKEVITVTPSTPMRQLRGILHDNRISGTPVVEDGMLVGIISIEDFIKWLVDGAPECAVTEWMTRDVVTVSEDVPLVQAVDKLNRFGFGRLPVVERGSNRLKGVMTKGDIIVGFLRRLEVDYRQAEMRHAESSHFFEDIMADKGTVVLQYEVPGGDFGRAGRCAGRLKTSLLRLGVSPKTARRVVIAAYEAEMNVIFFTKGGRMTVEVDPTAVRMKIVDDGPGIPDVARAMQQGFSTAPDWVRELGFGAGMGLHNINECADRMNIESTVGKGTRIEVDVLLENDDEPARDHAETST